MASISGSSCTQPDIFDVHEAVITIPAKDASNSSRESSVSDVHTIAASHDGLSQNRFSKVIVLNYNMDVEVVCLIKWI